MAMQKNQKLFVVLGSLLVMLAATMPLQPQVVRKRNLPVTAEPPATTKKPTDQVTADQPAATTRRPTDEATADPPARTRRRTDEAVARPAGPETKIFEKPRYMDDRLDWCLNPGFNCGELAALAFCHRRRFEDVKAFEAEVVGRSAQTRLMGSDQVCNADFCTAFAYITCSGPIGMDRVFANPTYKGYRLDVCWLGKGYCGKWSADAFCRAQGFSESLDGTPDRESGRSPTRSIGNDEICEQGCKGYQQIICK